MEINKIMADEITKTEKTKRGRKAATETEAESPANNADFGAGDDKNDGPILFFSHGPECERLPPIGDQNWIGRLADVAYWSGYFGGTPAQIAIRILAGDALGLKPANALFDLTINAGGSVAWRHDGNFQNTVDAIDLKAAQDNAAAGVGIERNAKSGVMDPAGVVVDISTGRPATLSNGESITVPEPDAKPESANPGPVLESPGEPSLPGPQGGNVDPGPVSVDKAAESASIPGTDPAIDPIDAEFDRVTAPDPPAEPASPFESKAVDTSAAAGLDVQATLDYWRQTIETRLRDLGFVEAKVSDKLNEFAEKSSAAKKVMFEQCEQMHAERLQPMRDRVLLALEKDGKGTPESRQGFFFYAEVPDDPASWTYREASRAWATIEKDFPDLAKAVA
jgi:hypothetical protein